MFMIISFPSSVSRGASAHQIGGSYRLHDTHITDVLENCYRLSYVIFFPDVCT